MFISNPAVGCELIVAYSCAGSMYLYHLVPWAIKYSSFNIKADQKVETFGRVVWVISYCVFHCSRWKLVHWRETLFVLAPWLIFSQFPSALHHCSNSHETDQFTSRRLGSGRVFRFPVFYGSFCIESSMNLTSSQQPQVVAEHPLFHWTSDRLLIEICEEISDLWSAIFVGLGLRSQSFPCDLFCRAVLPGTSFQALHPAEQELLQF